MKRPSPADTLCGGILKGYPELDRIADVVLQYRPKPKSKAQRKRARKSKQKGEG